MITFLRKIRHNLIGERKFQKYLLYAIGEIILVVIGILIALGINNYNEEKVLRNKEQTYLMGLQAEFETSKAKLQELMRVNKENYEGAIRIVNQINQDSLVMDESRFSELINMTLAYGISFNPNNSLLEEMVNSGSLKDIQNDSLRIKLTNWLSTMEDISEQEEELSVQREHVFNMFRTSDYSIHTILDQNSAADEVLGIHKQPEPTSNLTIMESQAFENNLLLFILTSHATQTAHYEPLLASIETILQLIQTELN